jgi:hypothetical protein
VKALLLAFWVAQGADIGTTVVGLNRGCVEMNPLYRSRSVPAMVGIKTASTIVITGFTWGAHKRGHKKLARTMLLAGIGVGAGAALWNVHVIPRC